MSLFCTYAFHLITYRSVPNQQMRAKLSLAGLGEKKISIFLHGDAEDIHHEFIHNFLKLARGGGYDLLRCSDRGGRELILIDRPKSGYTPQYLKSVVCSAKIYIRPLQKDLDLSHSNEAVSVTSKMLVVCLELDFSRE